MKAEFEQNNCDRGTQMLAYVYGEMEDRAEFESHLIDCQACIDEFAELSDSRFSVLEWQRGEFADLPTPNIVIPYDHPARAASTGWYAGLVEMIRASAFVPVGAAVILAAVVAGGYFLTRVPESVPVTASVVAPSSQAIPAAEAEPSRNADETAKVGTTPLRRVASRTAVVEKPIAARSVSRPAKPRSLTAKVLPSRDTDLPVLDRAVTKPALVPFEDEDDRSLRLSDLLDDEGV